MNRLFKYITIKGLSCFRLFRDIPFIYKALLVVIIGLTIYVLAEAQIMASITNVMVCLCVFVLVGIKLCSLPFSETILLKTLELKVLPFLFIKCLLLSIPFFVLNIYIGLVMITIGSICVYLLSGINIRNAKAFPSLYRKTSYQWLSSFRREGLWVLLVGFILFVIALYNDNSNMLRAVFGWLMCVPCFVSYYNTPDTQAWLVNYKGVSFLLRSKLVELLFNASLPTLICLPLVAVFIPADTFLFVKLFVAFHFVNLIMFYSNYLCYPAKLMSIFCSFILILLGLVIMFMHPEIAIAASVPVLLLLHILTIQNLKSVLYVAPTS